MKIQAPAALVTGLALFALSGIIADAYGHPALEWPLRWMSCALVAQSMFGFFTSTFMSIRRNSAGLWMVVIESATETTAAVGLVLAGAGAAGALAGKAVGYVVATAAGFVIVTRLMGGLRQRVVVRSAVRARSIVSYAGALFVVNATWQAIAQIDILLIGSLLLERCGGQLQRGPEDPDPARIPRNRGLGWGGTQALARGRGARHPRFQRSAPLSGHRPGRRDRADTSVVQADRRTPVSDPGTRGLSRSSGS